METIIIDYKRLKLIFCSEVIHEIHKSVLQNCLISSLMQLIRIMFHKFLYITEKFYTFIVSTFSILGRLTL